MTITHSSTPSSTRTTADPTALAQQVLARLEDAWNRADGRAFGSVYAPDASFVTIHGRHIVGSDAIGAGHAGIFTTIYAGSVNRMELVRATEVAQGVVVALSVNTLECPAGPLVGRHEAMSTSVITVDEMGDAQVVSTHNTLVTA